MAKQNINFYEKYLSIGFKPLRCKGYNPKYNSQKDYTIAKQAVDNGFTKDDFSGLSLQEIETWEKTGGWIGWVIPQGYIAIDIENQKSIEFIKFFCKKLNVKPPEHNSNRGKHFFFRLSKNLSGASEVYLKCGLKVTYRIGGKNYLILAPTNNRTWEIPLDNKILPELPTDLMPYDNKKEDDILNVLSWQIGNAYRERLLHGYDDIDTSFMAFLHERGLPEEKIYKAFQLAFNSDYDEKRTQTMHDRAKAKLASGETIRGTGSFIHRVREMGLREIESFANQLQKTVKAPSQLHDIYNTHETVKLKISTLKDIFSYPDPSYLIYPLIIENSLIILSAYTGIGKSILSLFIAFAIVTGKKLFDFFNVNKRGPVLIVDEENPGSFVKERVIRIGFTEDMPIYFLHFQKVKLDRQDCFNQLIQIIKDIKPTLVIFDALIRIHSAKENEASEMALVMERLRDIVNLGITVLVIHHHRKGTGDKKEAVRGSSDILGGVDIHLALEEKESYLILSSPKTRVKPIEPMRLKLETTEDKICFKYLGNEINENQIIINEIIEILKDNQKLGVKELLDELKQRDYEIGQNRLRNILQNISGNELIETTGERGKKLYSLNPTFTASLDIYIGGNCEAEKEPNNDLHSFTEEAPLNCEPEEVTNLSNVKVLSWSTEY